MPKRRIWKALVYVAALAAVAVFIANRPRSGAYIRVNGIGYEAASPMRAYLMSTADETGDQFAVRDATGTVVYSATVVPQGGKWRRFFVYALDFNITSRGSFTIAVTGKQASSPVFRVDQPDRLFSAPLGNALAFFQAQRDGADYVASSLRTAAAHLNDKTGSIYQSPAFDEGGHIKGDLRRVPGAVDASGGWFDAGDYLKFVHTTSYVEALMLMGVRDFPMQMGKDAPTSNFTAETKFGADWLLRMWDDNSETLFYQVGIGSGNASFEDDHSIWRLPQADDTFGGTDPRFRYIRNRPVLEAGAAGSRISPNLAGRLAADFALCSTVFRKQDPVLSRRCLLAAEHIYDLANTAPSGELLTAAPHDFYRESEWRDDMELGAIELYFALRGSPLPEGIPHTDPAFYLHAAAKWASEYIPNQKEPGTAFDVADVSAVAHFELVRAMDESPGTALAVSRDQLLADLQSKLDRAVAQSEKDPFGFGMRWQQEDTTAHGSALAVMASQYNFLTRSTKYDEYARRWAGNIFGSNAWGTSLIVGDGSEFPHCIHHQVANLAGSHNGQSPVLAGAAIEGPNGESASSWFSGVADWLVLKFPRLNSVKGMSACPEDASDRFAPFNGNGARFKDSYTSYSTSEPAIDLTAPSFLLFSWRIAGAPAPIQ